MDTRQHFDESIISIWQLKQQELASKISFQDSFQPIRYIGGLDVTFIEDVTDTKCTGVGALVVVDGETLQLVYSDTYVAETRVPYITGYLGFREIEYSKVLIERLQRNEPQLLPQVYLVDGCGYYHPRKCGYASQLGVELDIATIGVSKSFMAVDGLRMGDFEISAPYKAVKQLKGVSGTIWGATLHSSRDEGRHPIYVSVGHRVSLESCVSIVEKTLIHKIPEPIRLADLLSREEARQFRKKNAQ